MVAYIGRRFHFPPHRSPLKPFRTLLSRKVTPSLYVHSGHPYFDTVDLLRRLAVMCSCRPAKELHVFHTADNVYTKHLAQNSHFDYRPGFKAMIYLDDCRQVDSGGLFSIPGSFHWTRSTTAQKRLSNESPGRTDADMYFDQSPFSLDDFKYFGGNSGDILLFMTDNFHFQGRNSNIEYNRISRIHAYLD